MSRTTKEIRDMNLVDFALAMEIPARVMRDYCDCASDVYTSIAVGFGIIEAAYKRQDEIEWWDFTDRVRTLAVERSIGSASPLSREQWEEIGAWIAGEDDAARTGGKVS